MHAAVAQTCKRAASAVLNSVSRLSATAIADVPASKKARNSLDVAAVQAVRCLSTDETRPEVRSALKSSAVPDPVRRLVVGLGNPGSTYTNTRHNVGFHIVDAIVDLLGIDQFSTARSEFSFNQAVNAEEASIRLRFPSDIKYGSLPQGQKKNTGPLPIVDMVDQHSVRRRRRTQEEGVLYPKVDLHILKPMTYMNMSGESVSAARRGAGGKRGISLAIPRRPFKFRANAEAKNQMDELLVIVDDFDVPFGQLRLRNKNVSSHNGLKSVNDAVNTSKYVSLRVGIGLPFPDGEKAGAPALTHKLKGREQYASYVLGNFRQEELGVLPMLQRFAVDVLRVYFHRGFAAAQQVAHAGDVFEYKQHRQPAANQALLEGIPPPQTEPTPANKAHSKPRKRTKSSKAIRNAETHE